MRTRAIRTASLLVLAAVLLPAGAARPEAGARPSRLEFVPGSGFASAVKQQSTGIYVLGTTRIRTWTAVHYLLVRDGRGVQIHTKAGGAWLPKVEGSGGGHTVGVERFDQLLSLAGGVNRDVKQLPAVHRDRFLCVAGFGGCVGQAKVDARSAELADAFSRIAARGVLAPTVLTPASASTAPVFQPYFANGSAGQEFRFAFDASSRRLWFDGWGIRAGWLVPPLDEI